MKISKSNISFRRLCCTFLLKCLPNLVFCKTFSSFKVLLLLFMELSFKDVMCGEIVFVLIVDDLNVSFWFVVFNKCYQGSYFV